MKKIFYALSAPLLILTLVAPSIADTIRLKDGSVIRGQVVGFKDQQFVILIGSGAKGRRSRTTVYVEDIESIEFDAATTTAGAVVANDDLNSGNGSDQVRPQPSDNTSSPRINTASTSG